MEHSVGESRKQKRSGEEANRPRVAAGQKATGTARYAPLDNWRGDRKPRFMRFQRMTIVNGILTIVILIVILQLWRLTASMNAYLGGDTTVLLPAALVSLVCLGLNGGLLWYLYRLER